MKQLKLLKDFGDFKAGDVIDEATLDEATIVADLIADGTLEEVVADAGADVSDTGASEDAGATADAASTDEPVPPADTNVPPADTTGEQVEKTLVFNGKTVISKTVRVVEDKEVHHVRLEDGTEMDLTDEEHDAMIQASQTV